MAEWAVRMGEQRETGTYNTVGPVTPTNLGQIIESARAAMSRAASVTWVPAAWLAGRREPQLWGTVLFFEQGIGNIMRMSNERALANGLTTRPMSVTLGDALRWYEQQPTEQRATLTTGFKRKEDNSGFTSATMPWMDYLRREKETLEAWHASRATASTERSGRARTN